MLPSYREDPLRVRVRSSVVGNAARYVEGIGAADEGVDLKMELLLLLKVD